MTNSLRRLAIIPALMASIFTMTSPLMPSRAHAQETRAIVSGVVFDSVARRNVNGARVQLVSINRSSFERSVVADQNGHFRFEGITPGTYLVGFYDAAVDSLGLESPLKQIEVKDAREVRITLAIPSVSSIVGYNCRGAPDSSGLFLGVVRSARDGMPLARAKVRVRWAEMTIGSAGLQTRSPFTDVESNDIGGFAVCGVPANNGSSVEVRAWSGADSSGYFELEVPITGLLRRDLYVGSAMRERRSGTDSTARDSTFRTNSILKGNGLLRGLVHNNVGHPIEKARFTLTGLGTEYVSTTDGNFVMQSLPSGTYMLEARAIGYLSQRRVVDIMEGSVGPLDLMLENQNSFLDTVRVMGVRPVLGFDGFARRRDAGVGRFLDEEQIRKLSPLAITDVFRAMPGVHIMVPGGSYDSRTGYQLEMSGGGDGVNLRCVPNIFIDKVRVLGGLEDVDHLLKSKDLRAVEVYNSQPQTPGEFYTSNACGTIVLWTKTDFSRRKR